MDKTVPLDPSVVPKGEHYPLKQPGVSAWEVGAVGGVADSPACCRKFQCQSWCGKLVFGLEAQPLVAVNPSIRTCGV